MKLPTTRWQHILLVGSILLIALNLRPAVTVLSPLAERMRADGLSREVIGAMTTLPLILFGVAGLWAGWIGGRWGLARSLGAGLLLIAAGCLLRSMSDIDSQFWRFAGTILIGAGIALGNVLLPGLVKSRYPDKVGLLTSLYSTAMNLGAALGIAVAVPLADRLTGGWNASIAAWGLFAFATALFWIPQMLPRPTVRRPVHPLAGVITLARRKRAWQVAIFMGLQSSVFYSAVAWLPTVLQVRGMTENQAAGWVTGMQVLGCGASLLVPDPGGTPALPIGLDRRHRAPERVLPGGHPTVAEGGSRSRGDRIRLGRECLLRAGAPGHRPEESRSGNGGQSVLAGAGRGLSHRGSRSLAGGMDQRGDRKLGPRDRPRRGHRTRCGDLRMVGGPNRGTLDERGSDKGTRRGGEEMNLGSPPVRSLAVRVAAR